MVMLATELNKIVPSFSTDPRVYRLKFPTTERRVQKPLQDVYSLFIQSHLDIISYLRKKDPGEYFLLLGRQKSFPDEAKNQMQILRGTGGSLIKSQKSAQRFKKREVNMTS